jgi:hypothetical protein
MSRSSLQGDPKWQARLIPRRPARTVEVSTLDVEAEAGKLFDTLLTDAPLPPGTSFMMVQAVARRILKLLAALSPDERQWTLSVVRQRMDRLDAEDRSP